MKFSIIICTLNVVDRLSKTLDSILAQNFFEYEVIIVDGASSDGTLDIINKYQKKFSGKLNWISEKDSGIYDAMNKGVKMAKGEYLNVIGAGDWLEKDALERANECINQYPGIDAVYGKLQMWNKEYKQEFIEQSGPDSLLTKAMQHPALFYKRSLHDRFGLYDESYKIVSDYIFCLKAFYFGNAKAQAFDAIVDNYVMDGISSNSEQCLMEDYRARVELGIIKKKSFLNLLKKKLFQKGMFGVNF